MGRSEASDESLEAAAITEQPLQQFVRAASSPGSPSWRSIQSQLQRPEPLFQLQPVGGQGAHRLGEVFGRAP